MTEVTKLLPSRDGSTFLATVDIESDGALTILSNDGKGYRSAHRDHAQRHFGTTLWCANRLTWLNLEGVRVVLTRWHSQAYRTATVHRSEDGTIRPPAADVPHTHRTIDPQGGAMTDITSTADEDGRCTLCGYSLDVDGTGHSEDCRWSA